MDTKSAFDQAVSAAKQKDFQQARTITVKILKQNPNNIDALLLFSLVTENNTLAIAALKRILTIEPNHKIAQQRLASLINPTPATTAYSPPNPTTAQPKKPQKAHQSSGTSLQKPKPKKKKQRKRWVELLILGILAIVCLCLGFAILGEMSEQGLLPQAATSIPTQTENEIFAVIYENINAMNARSISRYMATVHPDSAAYDITEEALRESFANYQLRSSISGLEVLKQTSTRIEVSFVLTTQRVSGPAFNDNRVTGVMTLRKDGDVWKIYKQTTDNVEYLN